MWSSPSSTISALKVQITLEPEYHLLSPPGKIKYLVWPKTSSYPDQDEVVWLVGGGGDHLHHDTSQDVLLVGGLPHGRDVLGSGEIQSCTHIILNLRLFEGTFEINLPLNSWTSNKQTTVCGFIDDVNNFQLKLQDHQANWPSGLFSRLLSLWTCLPIISVPRYPYQWSRQIEKIGVQCNKIPTRAQVWIGTFWWRVPYLSLANEVDINMFPWLIKIFLFCSRARRTYCGHIFHPLCLSRAISVVPACPVCKQSLS